MAVSGLILVGALSLLLLVWLVVLTDGSYLGRSGVRFIYKHVSKLWTIDERPGRSTRFANDRLAALLEMELGEQPGSRVLDVATGTGRVPLLVAQEPSFDGHVWGLDMTRAMLARGHRIVQTRGLEDRITLVEGEAHSLPFEDGYFHLVTCIHAFSILGSPRKALAEMVRVTAPGGKVIVTVEKPFLKVLKPGKALSRRKTSELLESFGMTDVRSEAWIEGALGDEILIAFKGVSSQEESSKVGAGTNARRQA